jgi:hypothetical protein
MTINIVNATSQTSINVVHEICRGFSFYVSAFLFCFAFWHLAFVVVIWMAALPLGYKDLCLQTD